MQYQSIILLGTDGEMIKILIISPSVPKASATKWTVMQSLRVENLLLTTAYKGLTGISKAAVAQLTQGVEESACLYKF